MKISVIISAMLIAQVSASFFDVFQGAVQSVQSSFGKLFTDVVTDVKDTVDCTILAVEHVLSLSQDATARYYEKCGRSPNGTVTEKPKEEKLPKVEIAILNNEEYLKKEIPQEIEARINSTLTRLLNGHNPHDRLEEVEKELTRETERLADVSELVKRELEKLSNEIHYDLHHLERKDVKPSVDSILERLKLLESIEKGTKNSPEAIEIHRIIDDVLHKLNSIEAAETSENAKIEGILKDLEYNTNNSYTDLRQQIKSLKDEEARHLGLIQYKLVEHEKTPEHIEFIQNSSLNNQVGYPPYLNVNNTSNSFTTERTSTVPKDNFTNNINKTMTTPSEVPLNVSTTNTISVISTTQTPTKIANVTTNSTILSATTQSSDNTTMKTSAVTPNSSTTVTTILPKESTSSTTELPSAKQSTPSTTVSSTTKQTSTTESPTSKQTTVPTTPSPITKQSPAPTTELPTTKQSMPSTTASPATKQSTVSTTELPSTKLTTQPTTASLTTKTISSTTTLPTTKQTPVSTTELPSTKQSKSTTTETPSTKQTIPSTTTLPSTKASPALTTELPTTKQITTSTTALPTTKKSPITTTELPSTKPSPASTTEISCTTKSVSTSVKIEDKETSTKASILAAIAATTQKSTTEEDANVGITTLELINSSTERTTVPMLSLDDFLNYVDRVVSTGTTTSTTETTSEADLEPPTTLPPIRPLSAPPPYARSNGHIPPMNGGLPRLLRRSFNDVPNAKSNPTLPNTPANFFNRPLLNRNERPLGVTTLRPLNTENTNNLDDSDHVFPVPSKALDPHERALREAKRLIAESKRSRRIMDSIFNKNKGKPAFSLSNLLKFGK